MFIDDHQSSFMNFGGFLLFQKCTLHIHENDVEVFLINKGLGHRVSASKKNTTKITSKDFVVFFHLNST
ncbi:hypothetical protein, partial [Staphylococcus agnetis]|uniref:hypothetical protein n=1 Tax=Staphylococcus agnetis TaxID=985762 RepID=UPI00197E0E03